MIVTQPIHTHLPVPCISWKVVTMINYSEPPAPQMFSNDDIYIYDHTGPSENRVQEATHTSPQASIPSTTFQVLSPRGLHFNTTFDRETTNPHSCVSTATLNLSISCSF